MTFSLNTYRTAVIWLVTLVFFTGFSEYGFRYGISPLYWVVLFCGLIGPIALTDWFARPIRLGPVAIWAAGFLMLSILWYFNSSQTPRTSQEVQTRVLSVVTLIILILLFQRRQDQRSARLAIAVAAVIAVALNVFELFNPMTFSTIPGRSSGFFPNVNQSGAALVMATIIGLGALPHRLRLPFTMLTGIGIITTFSRAAILGWVMVVLFSIVRSGLNAQTARRAALVSLLLLGFFASPQWGRLQESLEERGVLTLDVLQRLSFLGGGPASDDSANERKEMAALAWTQFQERPLLGWGTGAYYEAPFEVGPHNIYLGLMVDHGILGIVIVPALAFALAVGVNRSSFDVAIPFIAFLLLWGFFSHNVLEERYLLTAVALVAAYVTALRRRPVPRLDLFPAVAPAGGGV